LTPGLRRILLVGDERPDPDVEEEPEEVGAGEVDGGLEEVDQAEPEVLEPPSVRHVLQHGEYRGKYLLRGANLLKRYFIFVTDDAALTST
jgi:hypothetical protein